MTSAEGHAAGSPAPSGVEAPARDPGGIRGRATVADLGFAGRLRSKTEMRPQHTSDPE